MSERETPEGFRLQASSAERAILELLHLAPKDVDLVEASLVVEGMTSIRPALMQTLLEECSSVKVRRLFLFLADRADLPVMRHLNLDRIDLGKGVRSLGPQGRYVPKYELLVPKELVTHV